MLKDYIEVYFFYFAMVFFMQYYTMLLSAGRENRNCIGKGRRNKLLWLLPKEMHYVTFLTKIVLVGTEVFSVAGIVMLVAGEIPNTLFLTVLFDLYNECSSFTAGSKPLYSVYKIFGMVVHYRFGGLFGGIFMDGGERLLAGDYRGRRAGGL